MHQNSAAGAQLVAIPPVPPQAACNLVNGSLGYNSDGDSPAFGYSLLAANPSFISLFCEGLGVGRPHIQSGAAGYSSSTLYPARRQRFITHTYCRLAGSSVRRASTTHTSRDLGTFLLAGL